MLPNLRECKRRLETHKQKSEKDRRWKRYDAAWNTFQKYKQESKGNYMLDYKATSENLKDFLNAFFACRPGQVDIATVKAALRSISDDYEKIQEIALGEGRMHSIREPLKAIYDGLCGISTLDNTDENGRSLIVPKSKALMALWGQTPGFDPRVRKGLQHDHLPIVRGYSWRYKSEEFCEIIEELDQWVSEWEQDNPGIRFSSLCHELPIGRIIDIIYWSNSESADTPCH